METLDRSRQNQDGGKSPFLFQFSSLHMRRGNMFSVKFSSSTLQQHNMSCSFTGTAAALSLFHCHTSYYTPNRDEYRGRMLFERMNPGPGALDGHGITLTWRCRSCIFFFFLSAIESNMFQSDNGVIHTTHKNSLLARRPWTVSMFPLDLVTSQGYDS